LEKTCAKQIRKLNVTFDLISARHNDQAREYSRADSALAVLLCLDEVIDD
jgi:hypothetical protein